MIDLRLGDCLELMKSLPDASVDAVITDFPYGLGIDYGDTYLDTKTNLKALIGLALPEMRRVSKVVLLTCGVTNMLLYPQPDWIMCWHIEAGGFSAKWGGFGMWQPILCYGTDSKMSKVGRRPDVITTNETRWGQNGHGTENTHPCPKPILLMNKLIEIATWQGDTVLDPFMGSGTTGVACVKLNRSFIGMEISPDYFAIAQRRIEEAQLQMALPL